jgi:hypothetical protein
VARRWLVLIGAARRPSINQPRVRERGWVATIEPTAEKWKYTISHSALAHNWLIYWAVIVAASAAAAPDLVYSLFRTLRLYIVPVDLTSGISSAAGLCAHSFSWRHCRTQCPTARWSKGQTKDTLFRLASSKDFFHLISVKAGHFSLPPAALKVEPFKGELLGKFLLINGLEQYWKWEQSSICNWE